MHRKREGDRRSEKNTTHKVLNEKEEERTSKERPKSKR